MPQMKPMNWLILMCWFMINYTMFLYNLYFLNILPNKIYLLKQNKINFILKW
uniref:ATP synthase F0 subunit 8 n=1 Tax=Aegilips sp. ZJUH 20220002 TaxID=2943451 RepID=A0A9E8G8K1_9HYME|nr:ATP synthase F0 subunit 8 [Aegilips sp. ZJUH 20220002]